MALTNSCKHDDGKEVAAPEGWKFQNCDPDRITLLKVRKSGDWYLDDSGDEIPKNSYYDAGERYEKWLGWDVIYYNIPDGHGDLKRRDRKETLNDIYCMAKAENDEDAGKSFADSLHSCRSKFKIPD